MWEDIDFNQRVIHIRHNAIIGKGETSIRDTLKTEAGRRDLPLTDELEEWLLKRKQTSRSKFVLSTKNSKPSIREQTAYYYNNYIEKHIVPSIGDIKLDKLTTLQIQQFYNKLRTSGQVQRYEHSELKDKGLSNRFIHGIHGVLRSALEQAVKERLITSNPAEGCKLPKIEKKEIRVRLSEQIGAYLQEANRRGLLPAYYLELTSGLHRGELLALLWTDLDVENMTISVTKQVNRVNGQLKVSQPKTSNFIRTIPIPKQAVDLLILEHEKHPDNPYMFPSPKTGTMYDPDSFRHTHEKILAAAGIEHICFHDLRHPNVKPKTQIFSFLENSNLFNQILNSKASLGKRLQLCFI